jgi:hypothetical protein
MKHENARLGVVVIFNCCGSEESGCQLHFAFITAKGIAARGG